jgi:hypothetical protein
MQMPDYNLSGLDPRTFQHLVQALCVQELGPGVVVYGDGRDGARDATFTGRVNYPSPPHNWDGYLVIQAKFFQKPTGDPKKDGQWLAKQLQADLAKFADGKHNPPDYYLLITNVDLSAVPTSGSLAKIKKILRDRGPSIGMKDSDVWDGVKVRKLLDAHRDVAIAYGGYITTGDVLQQMSDWIGGFQPDFTKVMSDFLQGELTGPDQYARLTDAGSTSERKTALARVFVDLPVTQSLNSESGHNPDDTDSAASGFVIGMLGAGALRYDADSCSERKSVVNKEDGKSSSNGRFVLIGGPGQGKSTLGQFLCQLHRAALLKERKQRISVSTKDTIRLLDTWSQQDGIRLPTARRFPVRIELRSFADDLAKDKCRSLLDFIAQQIDRRAGHPVNRKDVNTWLEKYPWLVVLDGLDEVPPASNRDAVLDQIQQFTAQCATRNADVFIVATSRPQGYSDAFDDSHFSHLYLQPLTRTLALRYANRLVETVHATDPDLRRDILNRLERASRRPTTERLLQSPLQVTILAILAELRGELPDLRWQLFQEYYQTILNRETQRNQAFSPILRDYEYEIGRIHQSAGLRLQVANELTGQTHSLLSKSDFNDLVKGCLSERFEGRNQSEATSVATKINRAALDRLVFLVSPVPDKIGFEIRSLQEFLAAQAIMEGPDQYVIARLQAIAPHAYWRNVFLFAAGRAARERQYAIESIIGICQTLNSDNIDLIARARGAILAGSRLALDLLEDGAFRYQVRYPRALADIALRLLELAPHPDHARLALVYSDELALGSVYQSALIRMLESTRAPDHLSAWIVLINLIKRGIDWAKDISEKYWPTDVEQQARILELSDDPPDPWTLSKIVAVVPKSSPFSLDFIRRWHPYHQRSIVRWLSAHAKILGEGAPGTLAFLRLLNDNRDGLVFSMVPIEIKDSSLWSNLLEMPSPSAHWNLIHAAARFALSPTHTSLARELIALIDCNWASQVKASPHLFRIMPWPFAATLMAAFRGESLQSLAHDIREGKLGRIDDWMSYERKWLTTGVSRDEIVESLTYAGFDMRFSWRESWIHDPAPESRSHLKVFEILRDLYHGATAVAAKRCLADSLITALWRVYFQSSKYEPYVAPIVNIPPMELLTIAEAASRLNIPVGILPAFSPSGDFDEDALEVLDRIGRKFSITAYYRVSGNASSTDDPRPQALATAFARTPGRRGLLAWLAALAAGGTKFVTNGFPTTQPAEPDSRLHSLIVRLFEGNHSENDGGTLALDTLSLIHDAGLNPFTRFWEFPRSAEHMWQLRYATDMLRSLDSNNNEGRAFCASILNDGLSENRSILHDPSQIKALKLDAYLPS